MTGNSAKRVRPQSYNTESGKTDAQKKSLNEVESLLDAAWTVQINQLQSDHLYWAAVERCMAKLKDSALYSRQLVKAARAYAAYGKQRRELQKDLLRIALRLAKEDSENQSPDESKLSQRDRSSGSARLSITGNLLLLFATFNSFDGSYRCHRVALKPKDGAVTHETVELPPQLLPLTPQSESQTQVHTSQQQKPGEKNTAAAQDEESSASDSTLKRNEADDTAPSGQRSPDASYKAESASPTSRTQTGNAGLQGLGESSCPSAEHMDAAAQGFKLAAASMVETPSVDAERPLVSQQTSVLAAYRIGFSEAGQPDLASTRTATASTTDGSAGDSGSDSRRRRRPKRQQQKQPRSSKTQPSAKSSKSIAATANSTAAQRLGRKRLVLLTLEYQESSRSATWRCPPSDSTTATANGATKTESRPVAKAPVRRNKSSKVDVEASGASSRKQSTTLKLESTRRKSAVRPDELEEAAKAAPTAASNSSAGRSGSSGKLKTGTKHIGKSRKTSASQN